MEITGRTGDLLREPADLAMLATFEDEPLPSDVATLLEPADFRGRAKQRVLLYPRGAIVPRRLLLVGLGKRGKVNAETVRQAAASAVQQARSLQIAAVTVGVQGELPLAPAVIGQAFAEGIELGAYRYWPYRMGLTTEETFAVERATVFSKANAEQTYVGVTTGQAIARGVMYARDLVNRPSNMPADLPSVAAASGCWPACCWAAPLVD